MAQSADPVDSSTSKLLFSNPITTCQTLVTLHSLVMSDICSDSILDVVMKLRLWPVS